jgi:hypothetical protein
MCAHDVWTVAFLVCALSSWIFWIRTFYFLVRAARLRKPHVDWLKAFGHGLWFHTLYTEAGLPIHEKAVRNFLGAIACMFLGMLVGLLKPN